jgi:putative ABC transport system permease protein
MQAVLGAAAARKLGLRLGDRFAGSHGIGGGGHAHEDHSYTVVGILAPSASVLDRLILTDIASVWQVHEDGSADDEHHQAVMAEREITLALITYQSPLAAVSFPRFVNSSTEMQAAAPAVEITRLLSMLGLGTEVLRAFAGVLLLTAGLSVFIALWSAVRERRGDLALLRMLGTPPIKVASLLLLEALWLGLLAAVLGLLLGQGMAASLAWLLELDNSLLIAGMTWPSALWAVPVMALAVSLVAALLPALGAYRVPVLELLQGK